jgi:hypothetical protein
MLKKLLLLVSIAIPMAIMAQKPVVDFDVKTYDFGKINEADGKVSYTFNFTNTGKSPLVINRVQASCGCTTPDWTKAPIEPGKKGMVTAIYNPEGRPGIFTKTITVYSNATEETITLIIKGEVIPRTVSDANPFPVKAGDLSIKQKVVQMNNVNKGVTAIKVLEIKNTGKKDIRPTVGNLPGYLSASVAPEVLKPNEEGKITFTFNSKSCPQWGPLNASAFLVLNGQKSYTEEYMIRVVGNVVEDFSKMTIDQKRKAPIAEVETNAINLGEIKTGSKKAAKFVLKNRGLSSLDVRRIINQNQEMNVRPLKTSIANGQSGAIVAEVNTSRLPTGDYKKTFSVQTNDPDKSFMVYVVQWKVIK